MKHPMTIGALILSMLICTVFLARGENSSAKSVAGTVEAERTHPPKAMQKTGARPRYQLLQDFPNEPLSEVCDAFTEMLNAFGPNEPQMRCEQKLHPGFPQFKGVKLQEQSSEDTFKYYSALRDLAHREIIQLGFTPRPLQPGDLKKEFELQESLGEYKYYLATTDKFIEGKTITLLIQERQGDCRTGDGIDARVSRIAYEWNAATGQVVTRHFSFHSIFTYDGKSMQGDGLLTSYWNEAELSDKPPGKFGSIWVNQANGRGAQSRICTIVFNGKR